MKGVFIRLLIAVVIGVIVVLLIFNIPQTPGGMFSDLDYQLSIEKNTPSQYKEMLSLAGTIIGIIFVFIWIRYRNTRDPHYWNGECDVTTGIPMTQRGCGKAAMNESIDFHRTVVDQMRNPASGQNGKPGIHT